MAYPATDATLEAPPSDESGSRKASAADTPSPPASAPESPHPDSPGSAARREWHVTFAIATMGYLAVGAWLISRDILFYDGLSRVANGYLVLFSRDPHLAAVGFVWNPLPSFAAMPLLLFTPIWPALASVGLAGTIVSAICGALNAVLVGRILAEFGLVPWARRLLTAAAAVHPLVLWLSAVGASEPIMLLWCLLATLALVRWVPDQHPRHLITAGLALGAAYATRYEAIACALAVAAGVAALSAVKHRDDPQRWRFVAADTTLVAFPFCSAFALWAAASKLIVGEWFATFSSAYGNAAQVNASAEQLARDAGGDTLARLSYGIAQLTGVTPLWAFIAAVALVVAWRHRSSQLLVPLAVLGSLVAFALLTGATRSSFAWLRFQVYAIPLTVLLAGGIAATQRTGVAHRLRAHTAASTDPRSTRAARAARAVATRAGAAVAVSAICVVAGWHTLFEPQLAREESFLIGRAPYNHVDRDIAAWLDDQHLPDSSVLTDVAYSGRIVLASAHPRTFVVTTDRDFLGVVADPVGHGVRYVLLTDPEESPADAVERAYPGMFAHGTAWASLVKEWIAGDRQTWRLYEVRR